MPFTEGVAAYLVNDIYFIVIQRDKALHLESYFGIYIYIYITQNGTDWCHSFHDLLFPFDVGDHDTPGTTVSMSS